MKKRRFWCWTLVVAAVLVGTAHGLRRPALAWLARHWQKEMATANEARAVGLVARVDDLGEPGLPVLVQSLGSPRECVARAARQALSARVDAWRSLRARDASPKLAQLALSLAAEAEQFEPAARLDAAELAVRILHRPLDGKVVDGGRVIAACETVLRLARSQRRGIGQDASPQAGPSVVPLDGPMAAGRATGMAEGGGAQEGVQPRGSSIPELAALPGGDLPADPLPEQDGDTSLANTRPPAGVVPQEPRWLDRPAGARPIEPRGRPPRLLGGAAGPSRPIGPTVGPPGPRQRPPVGVAGPPGGAAQDTGATHQPLSLEEPQAVRSVLAAAKSLDLIRGLREEDPASAADARAELVRRGFGEVDLAVGRQLFDPDPEVRKRLARMLPGMKSVDREPWLLWLARDPVAEVRQIAVGLLATTSDPALLAEVERLARADSDARVRRHAELIARRRTEEGL